MMPGAGWLTGQPRGPHFCCRSSSYPRKHLHQPVKRGLIPGIHRKFQECREILDVSQLEEFQATGDSKGHPLRGQVQLDIHALKMRPVKHRHFRVGNALLFMQLLDPLANEGRLFLGCVKRHHHWLLSLRPRRHQGFRELTVIQLDDFIRQTQDLGDTAVVRLDPEHLGGFMPVRKFDNIPEIRPAPPIDTLRIIPHHHYISMLSRQRCDQGALKRIGILVFIDKDELKLILILGQD